MIPKSVQRFSEKIMLEEKSSRFRARCLLFESASRSGLLVAQIFSENRYPLFRDRALIVDHPAVDVLADDACIAVDGRIPHGRVFDSHGAVEARIDDGRLRYARGA